jgi:uncharacterized protein DUF6600
MKMIRGLILSVMFGVPLLASHEILAADVSVGVEINSPDDFTEPLSTQGSWVNVGSYGRCWHPYSVDATWRPYCEGTWVSTDQGWYWQSNEPWSWACYHYGRWAQDPYYGWVWAPDTVWGPSWVCFREGGGYCGWAPLPPGAVFGGNGEFAIGVIPNDWFVFVGERHFAEPINRRSVIVNNVTIINRTTINTRITRVNNRVVNEGPRVQDLQKINHTRIQTANVQALRQHEKAPPITHRAAPQQPVIQRGNENPVERPVAEPPRETAPRKEPEIIRGPPSTPEAPPVERQRAEPAPAEHQEPVEQHPSEPAHGEKVAPQKAPAAPAHEESHGEVGHGEEGGHGEQGAPGKSP